MQIESNDKIVLAGGTSLKFHASLLLQFSLKVIFCKNCGEATKISQDRFNAEAKKKLHDKMLYLARNK
ncbi:MAG: hypothetical protein QOK54_10715 [Nitrososphaeraceae archaeon]|nr:hypothetical protein [Nitrososphaeraceae archaeon]MDW0182468.1 hypothetical protein [Nitrososphaeraceae archaeon]MDW0198854.1 hypothetical protein [Nitrososphaeraceae archaeon]MDW0202640.1 hypothetical protein [Nitrososphaeraceae archaeon]MDW0205793.1 hypothetical protein [Nitrososphaeraceae archaeon]